ncbi:hypothetical protein CQA29_09670 [Klebsiella pneumoniae]|nr:hypothetical protein AM373_06675 [Klebsiella pneumoniae]EPO18298.1 hypothetical protein H217_5041 [Klebsiella pneumoniae DMC0799]ATS11677.1 hypothetical protein CR231_00210 [Klebsiella pneumoniae]MBE8879631.1 hypothetical protein [Klebsiella pneumoniae]MBX4536750.1 hypothetical protein [Klebsiella pneumoniae]
MIVNGSIIYDLSILNIKSTTIALADISIFGIVFDIKIRKFSHFLFQSKRRSNNFTSIDL